MTTALPNASPSPTTVLSAIARTLARLSVRDRSIAMKLWGFEGVPWTYDRVAAEVGMTNTGVRSVESRVLRDACVDDGWPATLRERLVRIPVEGALADADLKGLGADTLRGLARGVGIGLPAPRRPVRRVVAYRASVDPVILAKIRKHPLSAVEIARALGIGRGSAVRHLARLLAKGTVERDGRRYRSVVPSEQRPSWQ